MRDKVARFISENNLLCQGDEVTVGLSGGADSVALLCVLTELAPQMGLTVRACHVNHCLRGQESDDDEAFCRDLCEKLCVPIDVFRCNVPAYCAEHGLSVETGARAMRYEALSSSAGGGRIATAHHLDDNAETVLLNLIRGTALDGLCGIPLRRDNIIRPLLCVTRHDIELYLASRGQSYRTDSTNLEDDAVRNRLRHAVLPVLCDINPSAARTIGRMTKSITRDREFINACAAEKYAETVEDGAILREKYITLPDALRLRVLRTFLREAGAAIDAERLYACDELISAGQGSRPLSGTLTFVASEREARVSVLKPHIEISSRTIDLSELPARINTVGDKTLEFHILSSREKKLFVNCTPRQFKNCLDCAKIKQQLTLRAARANDKIRLRGRGCTKTLKKLCQEAGIPAERRGELAVLESDGVLLWAEGFGASQATAACNTSDNVLTITVTEEDFQTWNRTSSESYSPKNKFRQR